MKTLQQIEKAAILQRLIAVSWRTERAAVSLGIGKTTFYRKLKEWDLTPPMRCSLAARHGVFAEWRLRVICELDVLEEPNFAGELTQETYSHGCQGN